MATTTYRRPLSKDAIDAIMLAANSGGEAVIRPTEFRSFKSGGGKMSSRGTLMSLKVRGLALVVRGELGAWHIKLTQAGIDFAAAHKPPAEACTPAKHELRKKGGLLNRMRWWPEMHAYVGECPFCHSTLAAYNHDQGGAMSPPVERTGPLMSSGSEDHEDDTPVRADRRFGAETRSGRRRPPQRASLHPGSIPGTGTDG